jgi:PhoPQ-activated pathogenicity-related protein
MKNSLLLSRFGILILFAAILIFGQCKPQAKENLSEPLAERSMTLLKDYVYAADPSFRYEMVHSNSTETYDYVVLKMISQNWLTKDIVNETEWWHWVSVVIPKDTPHQTGLMWIGGGSKDSKMPTEPAALVLETAQRTNSIVAEIHNVPFQPVVFANDTFGERYEDAIIAYGWRKFLEGGAKDEDAIWLARLPMTKAVKLAMDVATEVAAQKGKTLDKFVVAGASKRGWTTWTTAAVDDRVVAFVPIVIDSVERPTFLSAPLEKLWILGTGG